MCVLDKAGKKKKRKKSVSDNRASIKNITASRSYAVSKSKSDDSAANGKSAALTVLVIIAGILLSKISGLARDVLFARSFGAGIESDAYLSASRIPNLFFDFTLGAVVLSVFIPVFTEYMKKYGLEKSYDFANIFLNMIVVISLSVVIVLGFNSSLVIEIFAPGLETGAKQLAARLLVIMLPVMTVTAVTYIFIGVLQSMDEFKIPAIVSFVSNLALIVYICFFNKYYGIYGMAVSFVTSWLLQMLILLPPLLKKGYRYSFKLDFSHKGLRNSLKASLPVLVSAWGQPAAVALGMRYATFFGTGSVSALDYAYRLYLIISGVISLGLTNYIFPKLSKLHIDSDEKKFVATVVQSLRVILMIILPIVVGVSFFSRQIIEVVYTGGEFDSYAVSATAAGLFYYSFGMLGSSFCEVLNKAFYAKKDGKTPMIVTVLSIFFTFVLTLFFTKICPIGLGGIALSNSIVVTVSAVILVVFFCNSCVNIMDLRFGVFLMKIFLVNAIMLAFLRIFYGMLGGIGSLPGVLVSAAAFLLLYIPLLWLFGFEEIRLIFKDIKKKRVKC